LTGATGATGPTGDAASIVAANTSSGQALAPVGSPYTGSVPGVQQQYIFTGTDSVNITVNSPNWFLAATGPGNDGIMVFGGRNVIDVGVGSNFVTVGSGIDSVSVDDRNPSTDIWTTIAGFHAGDDATVLGIAPTDNIQWFDNQGAPGYSGLTFHDFSPNRPTESLTLSGYSTPDLSNGHLSVQFASQADGTPFMHIIAS
jgi:hypothetical protein